MLSIWMSICFVAGCTHNDYVSVLMHKSTVCSSSHCLLSENQMTVCGDAFGKQCKNMSCCFQSKSLAGRWWTRTVFGRAGRRSWAYLQSWGGPCLGRAGRASAWRRTTGQPPSRPLQPAPRARRRARWVVSLPLGAPPTHRTSQHLRCYLDLINCLVANCFELSSLPSESYFHWVFLRALWSFDDKIFIFHRS